VVVLEVKEDQATQTVMATVAGSIGNYKNILNEV
jgi:hypothetical protein